MLLGLHNSIFEVDSIDKWEFFISAKFFYRTAKFIFDFIGVYGLADHARSAAFLDEIEAKVGNTQVPALVGGDFNLIHGPTDKNNLNID
jgi:hypothetical protein